MPPTSSTETAKTLQFPCCNCIFLRVCSSFPYVAHLNCTSYRGCNFETNRKKFVPEIFKTVERNVSLEISAAPQGCISNENPSDRWWSDNKCHYTTIEIKLNDSWGVWPLLKWKYGGISTLFDGLFPQGAKMAAAKSPKIWRQGAVSQTAVSLVWSDPSRSSLTSE